MYTYPQDNGVLIIASDTRAAAQSGEPGDEATRFTLISLFQPVVMRGMFLAPCNIEFYATVLDSSVTVQNRVMHVGAGTTDDSDEVLMVVPIGHIDLHSTIVITVGLDNSHPNTAGVDSDPLVGISDGTNENLFKIVDKDDYSTSPVLPSDTNPAAVHDGTTVSSTTEVPSKFQLTFTPFNKFGFAETAQEGGYINTATFAQRIDITKPLFLIVRRGDGSEQYYFHYFRVEIYATINNCNI